MHATRTLNRRGAFTLLELLVVMTIILILAGLLLAGIFKALGVAKKLGQVSDIKGLHEAVAAFKTYFSIEYMPSKIRLSTYPSGMTQDDITYMRRLFPGPGFLKNWTTQGMVWSDQGDGVELCGHECLVFFLGGPQRVGPNGTPRPIGWSTNPSNPCQEEGLGTRQSFYDFQIERLSSLNSPWASYFPEVNAQVPYVYFSKKTTINTYTPGDCYKVTSPDGQMVVPYGNFQTGFMNPDSYQILGPGVDLKYGALGGQWTPDNAGTLYRRPNPGNDDVANFYGSSTLGVSR
jgi:prepilin-type N-terminal cleavage/methylation domain-containing protein